MLDLKRFLVIADHEKKIQKALRKSQGKASVDEVLSLYIVMILGNHKLNDHVLIQMTSKAAISFHFCPVEFLTLIAITFWLQEDLKKQADVST